MAELLAGAALGNALSMAYKHLLSAAASAAHSVFLLRKICCKLADDLEMYRPFFTEIFQHIDSSLTSAPTAAREWEKAALDFKQKLEEGRALLEECKRLGVFHPLQRFRKGRSILRLRREIRRFLQDQLLCSVIGLIQLDALRAALNKSSEEDEQERGRLMEDIINPMKETMMGLVKDGVDSNAAMVMDAIRRLEETLTLNDPSSSEKNKKQNSTTSSSGFNYYNPIISSTPQLPPFVVGLEERIAELRSMLLSARGDEKMVALVGGMGGIGKTTLALALCRDPQVREFFEDRIHFITVSKSPDMITLLSTIWSTVTGEKDAPRFQDVDDAYVRLQCRLMDHLQEQLIPNNKCLLVLDDVWSIESLQRLTFHIDGLWTLVTTRQAALLETSRSQTYNLGLLRPDDSRRLFCYWTFGQEDIPLWADETLVEEVISECKGLPLALRVIGGSLHCEAKNNPHAWRRTRDKLRQAEPLGEEEQNLLLGRLKTSVDALDQELRDCFMDLAAFPEDFRSSVDNLLDIWVYVRGMDWDNAYCALIELASRCLLNFDIQRFGQGRDHTTDYGCAGSLVFSQHDVMRDLAIQLGRGDSSVDHSRWLVMPQPQPRLPEKWHNPAQTRPLAAQVVSISSTGPPMTAKLWPALDMPHAEALFLYSDNGEVYELPQFLRNMRKLKVLVIRYTGTGALRIGSGLLRGLRSLRSFDIMAKGDLEAVVEEEDVNCPAPKLSKLMMRSLKAAVNSDNMLLKLLLPDASAASLEILKLESLFAQKEFPRWGMNSEDGLERLKVLEVQGCVNLRALPEDLGGGGGKAFKMLRCIGLWYCHYLEKLPASICELKHLEVLQMLECIRLDELPPELGRITSLQKLLLTGCKKLRALPDTIVQLKKLKLLDMSLCVSLRRLPPRIWHMPSLKTLNMSSCLSLEALPDFDFDFSSSIDPKDSPNCNIRELSLANCSSLVSLPPGFGSALSRLIKLSMKDCYELTCLPLDLGACNQLKQLDLSGCSELDNLPHDQLVKLSCLETLHLSGCDKLLALPPHMGRLQSLRRLELKGASKLLALPDSLVELQRLETLNLADCQSLTHLPPEMGRLQCLKRLDLRGSAVKLEELQESFTQLSKVVLLKYLPV